jgi:porphobilinogen deaminase
MQSGDDLMNPFDQIEKLAIPVWVKPLIIAILLASLTAFIYHKGVLSERAKWVAKENAERVKHQEAYLQIININRALEHKAVADLANLKDFYEGKLNDEKAKANAVIADVRAGSKRLYINTKAVPACAGGISLPAAGGGEIVAETRSELSTADAEFLVGFARDANETVIESNHVKDLLAQCRAHVDALRAQSVGSTAALSDSATNLTTRLNELTTKENQE